MAGELDDPCTWAPTTTDVDGSSVVLWVLDTMAPPGDASPMTESPYAVPEDDLVTSARVPLAEQVEVQSEPRPDAGAWTGPNPYGDGMGADADSE